MLKIHKLTFIGFESVRDKLGTRCFRVSVYVLPSVCSGARFLMVLVTLQARSQIFESKSKE